MVGRMRRSRGRPAHDDILTPAEWRVAEALRHGMTNRLIAERQKVSLAP
jgi:DNA-binding NarL/FixJ family response regulator